MQDRLKMMYSYILINKNYYMIESFKCADGSIKAHGPAKNNLPSPACIKSSRGTNFIGNYFP